MLRTLSTCVYWFIRNEEMNLQLHSPLLSCSTTVELEKQNGLLKNCAKVRMIINKLGKHLVNSKAVLCVTDFNCHTCYYSLNT